MLPTIEISKRAAQQVSRGSLWVYSNEAAMENAPKDPGAWCWFQSGGYFVGTGYFNRHSLIAGRIVSPEQTEDVETLLHARLLDACRRRAALMPAGSARLVFSEADLIPGLIADFYSGAVVLQSNTAGMDKVLAIIESILPQVLGQCGVGSLDALISRGDSSIRRLEGVENFRRVRCGAESRVRNWTVREDNILYSADLLEGQKTGFFLDQRENRRFLGRLMAERPNASVLDLYCYSGGWGIRALKSGASHVTFVDQSQDALDRVKAGLELNQIPESRTIMQRQDSADFLETASGQFDVIIADPPSFAKSQKALPQALRAYEKLNRLCWKRLKPGGILLSCSCDYHVAEPEFVNVVKTAVSKEAGLGQIIYRGTQAQDHPVLLSMAETGYLKCLGIRKLR